MHNSLDDDWVWNEIPPEHLWIFDKLILAKKCGYSAGPIGIDVPQSDWYVVWLCTTLRHMEELGAL